MTITDEAFAVLKRQEAKGLAKYGATLDRADVTAEAMIEHAIEEAADQLVYLIRLRQAMRERSE